MRWQKVIVSCLFLVLNDLVSLGQTSYSAELFSVDDGLPHNTINLIHEDRKGFIWLATFDGLSKYDGYTFYNYKTGTDNKVLMKNDRIDKISEDRWGRIWMNAYANKPYCFDPATESFWGIELISEELADQFVLSQIQSQVSGKIWLNSEKQGCICVLDSLYNTLIFNKNNRTLDADAVYSVFEDSGHNSWILSNKGLKYLPSGSHSLSGSYFDNEDESSSKAKSFFSAIELQDEIWFGGSEGFIAKLTKKGTSFRTQNLSLKSDLIGMSLLDQQRLLIISRDEGFCILNIFSGEVNYITPSGYKGLKTRNLVPIGLIRDDLFWFVSDYERGITLFDLTNLRYKFFPSQSNDPNNIPVNAKAMVLQDQRGRIWVQPYGGGFSLFNPQTLTLEPLSPLFNSPGPKLSNLFHAASFDQQGNLWANVLSNGLLKLNFHENYFQTLRVTEAGQSNVTRDVRALFQDKNKNLWVATKEGKVYVCKTLNGTRRYLSPSGEFTANASWEKPVYVVFEDHRGRIWLGSKGAGIYILTPCAGGNSYSVSHCVFDINDPNSLSHNDVYSICQDAEKQVWIGTFGGGINMAKELPGGTFHFIHPGNQLKEYPLKSGSKVRNLAADARGNLCIATNGGFLMCKPNYEQPGETRFHYYGKATNSPNSLPANDIIDICLTRKGNLFLASQGGGLIKAKSFDEEGFPVGFTNFSRGQGLPSNNLLSLLEDHDGKLWITTEGALARFDPELEFFEVFPEAKKTIQTGSFSENARCKLISGEILFGFSEGIVTFKPDQVKINSYTPYLALTHFQLFNMDVPISSDTPLKKAIDGCEQLTLTHKQNFFTIGYAALDYQNPNNIKYAYQLEGFDAGWNYVQKQRSAVYTNVPKGNYTFRVRSTNSAGVWTDNERSLAILVKPSFWETPWAYALYFFLFAAMIFLIDYNLLTIYRLKSNVKLEKKMSDLKQKFFIDISHEIRTPLTMITAPVEYMLNDHRTPELVKKQLFHISQNTNRMLRLVNQILDYRKIQETRLQLTELDLVPCINEIFTDFSELALDKHLNFSFTNQAGRASIWASRDGFEKMMMNLLSNAFKYTPAGKSIEVKVTDDEKTVAISVIDQGEGISKEKQKRLFHRFESLSDDASKPGTGIGLSIVKELADKHGAKIRVESEPGKGSVFSLIFLKGKNHFSEEVEFLPSEGGIERNPGFLEEGANTSDPYSEKQPSPLVLIVEDDQYLCSFMKTILEHRYSVCEAPNGQLGFESALKLHPDFIVSDIMMPVCDGIEFLHKIRNTVETSHIPFVLLSAKTNIESKLQGLSYGADDYITKPFSVAYFQARIANLLEQRKRLQEIFGSETTFPGKDYEPKPCLITPHDELIMEKVMKAIEANIDNSDFGVEDLGQAVGLNRTTLFYKLKSLTGFSPVEFIRDIRLKQAGRYIAESSLLIKEVAFMTGFSDLKYFGKCFKTKFGLTPLEYRKNKNSR